MKEELLQQAAGFRKKSKKKQRLSKVVTLLAAVVVFCTTYALILPAITMEQNLVCEAQEHIHDDSCYLQTETVMGKYLVCGHTEAPLDPETIAAIFPDAQSVAAEEVTDPSEAGQQTEPEETTQGQEAAQAADETDETAETLESEASETTGETYAAEADQEADVEELTEESETHVHTAECFSEQPLQICSKAEHIHTESCYEASSMLLSAYNLSAASSEASSVELETYVTNQTGGQFEVTLLNPDNTSLPKDEDGNYIAVVGQEYKLTIGMYLPDGILPGTYTYQLPAGLSVEENSGKFTFTDKNDNSINVDVGTWTIDENGLITFVFNENSNKYTEVTISASMALTFTDEYENVSFVGHIEVVLTPPEVEEQLTVVRKGGSGVAEDDDGGILYDDDGNLVMLTENFDRIVWSATVEGSENSNIVGNVLTDTIIDDSPHYYSEADMAQGVLIGFDDADGEWHYFTVYPDSEGMTWTSQGWTYTVPESIVCGYAWCQKTVTLSNEYQYYITYFSTTSDGLETGTATYRNAVEIDGDEGEGWLQQTRGDEYVGIIKEGEFNTSGGTYDWTVTAQIPAAKDGEPYVGGWFVWDTSKVSTSAWVSVDNIDGTPYPQFDDNGKLTGNLTQLKVTITYNGSTYEIPYIDYADENDLFCYEVYGETDEDGVYYSTGLYIGMRCICEEERCLRWHSDADKCVDWTLYDSSLPVTAQQFCGCWRLEHNADITITYSRSSTDLIDAYGGLGYYYQNSVALNSYVPDGSNPGKLTNQVEGSDIDRVKIPGILNKALAAEPTQYNDYTASYKVTLNDDMIDFSQYDALTIVDTMSDTLVYVIGTMEITAEDASGNVTTLSLEDGDYTVDYDADAHKITVVLTEPGQYRYVMSYDTQIVVQTGVLTVDYNNSVYIDLFGTRYTEEDTEKILSDIIYFSKNYQVEINKTSNGTNAPLAGAAFGLYAESGELIESDTTDDDGQILFETHVEDGVILRAHTHYYLQEITAPDGYHLDTTKYWLVFCDNSANTCDTCGACAAKHSNTVRIPYETVGAVNITNYYAGYELPNTGGGGTAVYTVPGAFLVSAALITVVYTYSRRRKEEKASP